MADPIYLGETSLLIASVFHKTPDLIEVRLTPKPGYGKTEPSFEPEHVHELRGMVDALRGAIGPEYCTSQQMPDHRMVVISRPAHIGAEEFPSAVIEAVHSLAIFPPAGDVAERDGLTDRAEHIAGLVDEALTKNGQFRQVKHIIGDTSLTLEQRNEALEMLRIMRDARQNELG